VGNHYASRGFQPGWRHFIRTVKASVDSLLIAGLDPNRSLHGRMQFASRGPISEEKEVLWIGQVERAFLDRSEDRVVVMGTEPGEGRGLVPTHGCKLHLQAARQRRVQLGRDHVVFPLK
jgi:hypothetical protein